MFTHVLRPTISQWNFTTLLLDFGVLQLVRVLYSVYQT